MQNLISLRPEGEPQSAQRRWTYEDYLKLPDDGRRYEIIQGILYVDYAPDYDHQFTVAEIHRQLANHVVEHQLGRVLPAPFEVHLSEDTRPVQPDVIFIRTSRLPAAGAKFFRGAPDLVVEVISPGSIRRDRNIKFAAYEQAGVAEYWLVDPKYHFVEVYTLSGNEYALLGQFDGDDLLQSKILPKLTITAHTLFVPA
jgi:Uma2 family endonuclease